VVNLERASFLSPGLTGSNQPCRYKGKTAYLYLRIIENMIEGRPFLYQAIGGTVYHVAENGVEAVQSWSSQEIIVAFVDGDEGDYKPDEILLRRSVDLNVSPLRNRQFSIKSPKRFGAESHCIRSLWPATFPVDSIVYDPNEEGLTCIQITTNSEHPIAVSGLKRIQDGSTLVHRLQISALIEQRCGASYLLCRQIWRRSLPCKS